MSAIITASGLTKHYGKQAALDGTSFTVEARMHALDEVDRVLDLEPLRQDGDVGDEAHLVHQLLALGARIHAQHGQFALELGQAQDGLVS